MFLVHLSIVSFIAGSMSRSSTTEMSNVPSSSSYSSSTIPTNISSLCLGTGRFLRSVLVPALLETNDCNNIVLIQPRGTSFVDYCYSRRLPLSGARFYYEVDTVEHSGDVVTDEVGPIQDVISMARDRMLLSELIQRNAASIRIVGVGVTEAGLASYKTGAMHDLVWIFYQIFQNRKIENSGTICVLNTDNVPFNGDVIQSLVLQAIDNDDVWSGERLFKKFCTNNIVFFNTMVDRITSQRKDSQGLVPLAEPMPLKALVIEDAGRALPQSFQNYSSSGLKGVLIRRERDQFQLDVELKLVVANAVHTACAHALALSSYLDTTVLSKEAYHLFMPYLDSFFRAQILPSISNAVTSREEAEKVYAEWRYRLMHPHFGLSTFFIGQNGVMKSGIRISPTAQKLLVNIAACQKNHHPITAATAFAYASILRYVTPATTDSGKTLLGGVKVYRGWLDPTSDPSVVSDNETQTNNSSDQVNENIMYADNMHVNCREGWYEFKCSCLIHMPTLSEPIFLSDLLANYASSTPSASSFMAIIKNFLVHPQGGNLTQALSDGTSYFHDLVSAIATIYARMVAGDTSITILQEMLEKKGIYSKFGFETPCSALVDFSSPSVTQLHASTMALQPLHYRMCPIPDDSHLMQVPILINEQSSSTYSEATMEQLLACIVYAEVASVTVLDVHTQLFPPSHGSMCLFGIDELLTNHYLVSEYFMTAGSATPDHFYELSKTEQADVIWNALFLQKTPLSEATRGVITTLTKLGLGTVAEVGKRTLFPELSAVRASQEKLIEDQGVEAFCDMIFDVAGVKYAIMTNVPFDAEEVKQSYLIKKPYSGRFRTALLVDDFLKGDKTSLHHSLDIAGYKRTVEGARQYLRDSVDIYKPEYMIAWTPHDFQLCILLEDGIVNGSNEYFMEALMKVCEELNLPIALKIGAHCNTYGKILVQLCTRFPKVRFLATFLSERNQHDSCVLAKKLPNLHMCGCCCYSNSPFIVQEATQARLETLGTAFTAQHSGVRVLDQLVYKWSDSRSAIAQSLFVQYFRLISSGWTGLTRSGIRRDVKLLFGGSYEEFLTKPLG